MGLMAVGCQLSIASALAQKVGDIISGTVVDDFGPVMAANVVELDAANRIVANAVTDINGNFSFRLKNPKNKLRVTYVGYKTVTLPINKLKFNIRMQDEALIDEVVITSKKKTEGSGLAIPLDEISTARQSIDMTEFEGLGITSVDEALQGRIAGLDIIGNSGDLGSGSTMRLRGSSSISSLTDANPLIVVDGNTRNVDMSNFDLSTANEEQFSQLLNINPEDIASITVLKDAGATAIYGSQGANGVIEITDLRPRTTYKISYGTSNFSYKIPKGKYFVMGDNRTNSLDSRYFGAFKRKQIIGKTNYTVFPFNRFGKKV